MPYADITKRLSFLKTYRNKEVDANYILTFELEPPTKCKSCKETLDYTVGKGQSSRGKNPSFDRIDNNKGYIKDNVAIICMKCNNLKSDATLQDLEYIVNYMKANINAT